MILKIRRTNVDSLDCCSVSRWFILSNISRLSYDFFNKEFNFEDLIKNADRVEFNENEKQERCGIWISCIINDKKQYSIFLNTKAFLLNDEGVLIDTLY